MPPLPPHVTGQQVRHCLSALLHGDPQAVQIVIATAREWWEGVTARK